MQLHKGGGLIAPPKFTKIYKNLLNDDGPIKNNQINSNIKN